MKKQIPKKRIPEEQNEAIYQGYAEIFALHKICNKIGTEIRSGQFTSELAVVDFGSDFIYDGVLVYFYGHFRTEKIVFSYLCICGSVHVEFV